MGVSYVNRKCDCGGKLKYDKGRKVWVCLYCGSEIEREEQYDGMFTIKNVVRQTLLDVSYRRLDNAEKNLVECEKIDSRYIGTIIANLCYLMIKATNPGACNPSEIKGLIAKIKRYNDTLQTQYEGITDEEEALYEFFDTSDIYATLILVYDSLNDKKRQEFMMELLKTKEVFSVETNKNLLGYSLKNKDFKMLDEIIDNSDNIDKRFALSEVLSKYPDNEKKAQNAQKLFGKKALEKDDKPIIDNYLTATDDAIATKAKIVKASYEAGIKASIDVVLQNVLAGNEDVSITNDVIGQLCSSKLSDEEVYRIVEYCFSGRSTENSLAGLSCLKNSNQYVVLDHRHLVSLLNRNNIVAEDKLSLLKKALEFNVDNKSREVLINNYLCFNQDNQETRGMIIPFLLETVKPIPTSTFENYVLKCNTDGTNKHEIVKQVLKTGINISFYYDLLSKYLFTNTDDGVTKGKIIDLLLCKGIKVEPKAFTRYICSSNERGAVKMSLIKKMLANGSQLNSDTISIYLEGMRNFSEFDSELFGLLFNNSCIITDNALVSYVLYCRDRSKAANAVAMGERMTATFGSQGCRVKHNGNDIECSLLQGYILTSGDSFEVTSEIVKTMVERKAKLNSEIRVSGKGMKFKKYAVDNKSSLSQMTTQICEEYKVFSKFFI